MIRRALSDMRVPPVIQVLSLDAMGTLIKPREPIARVYAEAARRYGIEGANESGIAAAFPGQFRRLGKESPCFGAGNEGGLAWWRKLIVGALEDAGASPSSMTPPVTEALAQHLFDHYANSDAWTLIDDGAPAALARIRLKGIVLCVVSNFDSRLKGILAGLGLDRHFQMVVLSGELGIEKPDGRIFEAVLRQFRLETNPQALLHIGDDVERDYRTARAIGARALLFDPKGKHDEIPKEDRLVSFSRLALY